MQRTVRRPWFMPAIGIAAMLLTGSGLMSAATPNGSRLPLVSRMAQTDGGIPPLPRPAYIYAGRCGELDEIQWPLNPLVAPNGASRGSGAVDRTENSYTANVPLSIDAMLAGSFAVNVHESGEDFESVLSCGNVGGVTDTLGQLVIGLRQYRGSGVSGIAVLAPSPVDAAMTLVSVFITGAPLGDETGTIGPSAAPAPDDGGVPSGDVPPVDQVPVATVPAPVVQDPVVVDPGDDDDDDDGDDGDDDGGDD